MLGIEADEHGRQDNHQEPSQAAGNVQLQLKVFPNTHPLIVHARKLIRSLSHPSDVTHWRRHTLATCRCLVAEPPRPPAVSTVGAVPRYLIGFCVWIAR
jgi:hypothetical protein